jgi:hypothetical protein
LRQGDQPLQHFNDPESHGRAAPGQQPETPATLGKFRSTPIAPMILYALDAQTGKQLYASGKILGNWVHFSQPTVAQGKVFLVSHDAHVYAFGLSR